MFLSELDKTKRQWHIKALVMREKRKSPQQITLNHHPWVSRLTSLILSFLLSLSNVDLYALDQIPKNIAKKNFAFEDSKPRALDPRSVLISPSLGLIKEIHIGEGSKLIIHVQHLHAQEEAQKKISDMIKMMVSQYWVGLVCVEGAEGTIDVSAYREIPEKDINKKVAAYLLKEGILSGPEYLAITTDEPFHFAGVERK